MYLRKNPQNSGASPNEEFQYPYSIIYELKVEKVWYSRQSITDTIFIEDHTDFIDRPCTMRVGHSYVVPILETGVVERDFAKSESEEDTLYSTLYPFHPQIEVTEEGNYIVSNDWKTLVAENAIPIIVDVEQDIFGCYADKMFLVPAETFTMQLSKLMKTIIE